MKKQILHILIIPFTALFLFNIFDILFRASSFLFESNFKWEKFEILELFFQSVFFLWLGSQLILEIVNLFKKSYQINRILNILRYTPIVSYFLAFLFIVPSFDAMMIQYSKQQIRNYVLTESNKIEKPDLYLHNDYRGWCGNGYEPRENELYIDTAIQEFDNAEPKVRARTLLITAKISNSIFHSSEDKDFFQNMLKKACADSSEIVVKTAESFLLIEKTNCKEILSKK
ncbi:MAG: hypothetical protein MUC29_00710 [Pyrinomonadaceae bacterium]|jgi:hypothetical protein|nr:hypothetical protein [Pyrinomonadaceae bacterium]